jgi:hypothetical protein
MTRAMYRARCRFCGGPRIGWRRRIDQQMRDLFYPIF